MNTINISLPSQLKAQADSLIKKGYYASFSDLVRTALRKVISSSDIDLLVTEAMEDVKNGKATILKTNDDIDRYINSMS
jgi:Arc/MetJ-type ribon-helix-helix transcriptional regulator